MIQCRDRFVERFLERLLEPERFFLDTPRLSLLAVRLCFAAFSNGLDARPGNKFGFITCF